MLYRITYKGYINILHAYKNEDGDNEWEKIQHALSWMKHIPKMYFKADKLIDDYETNRLYFTSKGLYMFNTTVLPIILKKLNRNYIEIEEISDNLYGNAIYEDEYIKIYNVVDNTNINEELENINEVYFGKTPEIQAIEDQLDKFRKSYIGKSRLPSNDPDLNKLGKMIGSFFGIRFALNIIFDPVPMANSIPMTKHLIDKDSIVVNQKTYKFRPESGFICIVNMSSGLIFSSDFTTEEIMVAILYELGFLFMVCFTDSNITLYNIYHMTKIVNTGINELIRFHTLFHYLSKTGRPIAKSLMQNGVALTGGKEYKDIKDLQNIIDSVPKEARAGLIDKLKNNPSTTDAIKSLESINGMIDSNSKFMADIFAGGVAGVNAYNYGSKHSPSYRRLVNEYRNIINHNNSIKSTCIRFIDYIGLSFRYVSGIFEGICTRLIAKLGIGKTPSNVLQFLGVDDLILPYASTIMKAKNPINWINMPVEYKIEQAASNFPTMYGYGAAEISYFAKMNSNNRITLIKYILKKAPFIGAVYDVCMIPAKVLNGIFDNKSGGVSRCIDQINLLKNELNKQNIDNETKSIIQKDLNECILELNKLTNITKGIKDPDIIKKLYNKFLQDCFEGTDLKDRLFNNLNKFKEYDMNYNKRVNGGE